MERIILKIITYWCFVLFKNFENINVMRLASNKNTLYIFYSSESRVLLRASVSVSHCKSKE